MRILQVIPYYYPATAFGGPLTVCQALCEDMVRRGHSVSVITTDVASRTSRCSVLAETINGVAVTRVPNWSQALVGRANAYLPFGVGEAIEAGCNEADSVHVHEFFNWLTFAAVGRASRRNIPTLLSGHAGMSVDPARGKSWVKRGLFELFGRNCIERVSAVQAATATEASVCRQVGVAADKIHVIPNGVPFPPAFSGNADRFREAHGLGGRTIALFVGRLQTQKGIDLIVTAAQAIPEVCFVLAGPAENRPDFESTGWRGANVYVTGQQTRQELADIYAAASMFILPSHSEGLPMTALEALSYGIPVILSRHCNLPEAAAAGAGIEIDTTSEALVGSVRMMLERRQEWQSMQRAARTLVEQRFQLSKIHDHYEKLYRKLIDGKSAAHNQLG